MMHFFAATLAGLGFGLLAFGFLVMMNAGFGLALLIAGAALFLAGILLVVSIRLETMLKRHGRALRDEIRDRSGPDAPIR